MHILKGLLFADFKYIYKLVFTIGLEIETKSEITRILSLIFIINKNNIINIIINKNMFN